MFDVLVASRGARPAARVWWGAPLVLLLHAGLVAVAIWATRHDATARPVPIVVRVDPPPATAGGEPRPARTAWHVPAVPPVVVPGRVGTLDIAIAIENLRLPRPGMGAPTGGTWAGDGGDPVPVELVEQRPELLSAPPPEYPDRLRRLGVEGSVIVRVVVDTSGRVEPASVTVLRATHPELVAPVRRALVRALFRPARVHGRAVRVLVEIPFAFRLTGSR